MAETSRWTIAYPRLREGNAIITKDFAITSRASFGVLLALLISLPGGAETCPVKPLSASIKQKFDAGKYSEVVTLLQAELAKGPQDDSLAFWLSRSYFELGRLDDAISFAERAVESQPSISEYHLWLGRACGRKAEKARSFLLARKVRVEFETAVNLDPANLPARRDLMEYYLAAPWFLGGGKEKGWREAAAIDAVDRVEGCLARGSYWRTVGDPGRAELEYARVMELKPARIEPYLELADYYLTRRDAVRIETAVEAAARIEPHDPRLDYYHAVAFILARKELREAEQWLKAYLSAAPPRHDFPSRASAREWLGQLYEETGKPQLAEEQYRAALELDPGRENALEGLRRVHKAP